LRCFIAFSHDDAGVAGVNDRPIEARRASAHFHALTQAAPGGMLDSLRGLRVIY
jgi:hypothetical protein